MFEESVSSVPSIWASMNSWFTPTVLFVIVNLMIGTIAISSSLGSQKHKQQGQQQQQPQQQEHRQLVRSPSVLERLKSINFHTYRSQQPTTNFQQTQEPETHYTTKHTQEQEQQEQPQLVRSPSLLQKLKSINLYNYISQEPNLSQSRTTTTTLPKTQESENRTYSFQKLQEEEDEEDDDEDEEEEEEEDDEDEHVHLHDHDQDQDQDQDQEQEQEHTLDEIYSQLKGIHVSRTKSDTKPSSGELPKKLPRKMKKSASVKSVFSHFEVKDDIEARRPATVRDGRVVATEADDDEVDGKADDFINKFKQQLKLQRMDSILRSRK